MEIRKTSWTRDQYPPQGHSTMVNEMERWRSCQRCAGSGRPRKSTPVTDRKLIIACKRNRFDQMCSKTYCRLEFWVISQLHKAITSCLNTTTHLRIGQQLSLNASMRIRFQLSRGHCYHPTFLPSNMPGMFLVNAAEIPYLLHLSKVCNTD